jgi:hypothetical protein
MKKSMADAVKDNRDKATKVFCFTLQDIAEAIGKSVITVWRATASGKLDPRNIVSIAEYVMSYRKRGDK